MPVGYDITLLISTIPFFLKGDNCGCRGIVLSGCVILLFGFACCEPSCLSACNQRGYYKSATFANGALQFPKLSFCTTHYCLHSSFSFLWGGVYFSQHIQHGDGY